MSLDEYESEHKPMQVDKVEYLDCINKVIHGDCLEIMPKIKPKSVDMIFTDLPYGITGCEWDVSINVNSMWECFENLIKEHCGILLFGDFKLASTLYESHKKWYRHYWIYQKIPANFGQATYAPMNETEILLLFGKNKVNYYPIMEDRKGSGADRCKYVFGEASIANTGEFVGHFAKKNDDGKKMEEYRDPSKRYPSNVQYFNNRSKGNRGLHPTQKPVLAIEYWIKTYTQEGDTILDCCAGSGTTGVACKNTGRNYICIEKEKEYVDVMRERGLSIYE